LTCDVGASILNSAKASPRTSTDTSRGVIFETDTTSTGRGGLRRRCGRAVGVSVT
jgi:hypothetical protein